MQMKEFLKTMAKRSAVLLLAVLMLASVGFSASASAFVPYTTYTYDFDGMQMKSPHAYVADSMLTGRDMKISGTLTNPSDLFIDSKGYVYLADTGSSRVVIMDENLQMVSELSLFYNEGAILPRAGKLMEEEAVNYEDMLTRRLKSYAEDKEDPVTFEITLEELILVEERVNAKDTEDERMAELDVIAGEYAEVGRTMLPYERMVDLMTYVMPIKVKYDSLTDEEIELAKEDAGVAHLCKTDDDYRSAAYYYHYLMGVSGEDPSGDHFASPEGVFVSGDGTLYVADTENARVVKLARDDEESWTFKAIDTFYCPESSILPEEFVFKPSNLVVDNAGRIYVNVKNVNSGIMQLSTTGEFMGYFGAQKVQGSVVDWFLRLFQTEEQRARAVRIVPRVYNNIGIDSKNFVWITANSMDNFDLFSYLSSGDSGTAPIKRLNPSGNDVLVRNGNWAPGGDVPFDTNEVSSIIDVAVKGDTGIYTLVDDKRNKLFTYDGEGNLLYAFGGTGSQLGVFQLIGAAVYQGTDLLVLDKQTGTITRFKQTAYATAIEEALTADEQREYLKSEECWKQVQKLNANFDLAYVGLAKCYLRNAAQASEEEAKEYYQTAMEYYKLARNTEGYSKAFKEYRSLYVRDNLLLILAVPTVLLVLVFLAIRAINKVNAKLHVTGTPTTFTEELCYGWRAIFHPINGFWEIKREKRGSMRAAFVFLALAVVAICFQATGTAYLFNQTPIEQVSLMQQASNVLLPVVLWVLASWSFTTLMSGEGSMKDIFIAVCYSLIPMILMLIPVTLASNICSLDEGPFLTFFTSLGYGWMVLLVIFGSMVIHDYNFSKNIVTVLLSIFGMAAIMFIVLLLISLTGKMFGFVETIYREIAYRL